MGSWLSSFSLGKEFSNEEELKDTCMKHPSTSGWSLNYWTGLDW